MALQRGSTDHEHPEQRGWPSRRPAAAARASTARPNPCIPSETGRDLLGFAGMDASSTAYSGTSATSIKIIYGGRGRGGRTGRGGRRRPRGRPAPDRKAGDQDLAPRPSPMIYGTGPGRSRSGRCARSGRACGLRSSLNVVSDHDRCPGTCLVEACSYDRSERSLRTVKPSRAGHPRLGDHGTRPGGRAVDRGHLPASARRLPAGGTYPGP